MKAQEWLNVLAILESMDDVPGMPPLDHFTAGHRVSLFKMKPIRFLQRADDATRDAIWAEVERRQAR